MKLRTNFFAAGMLVLANCMAAAAFAALPEPTLLDNGMRYGHSYQNDLSMPLYYLPPPRIEVTKQSKPGPENPRLPILKHVNKLDQAVQNQPWPPYMPAFLLNFDGVGFPGVACNCAPPDTNGAVGTTQYVQSVNNGFQVFDKTNGNSVLGPIAITSVWTGFGGVCETNGDGDPVVLFDKMNNRWLISQFAGSGVPTDECVAISQTDDATGAWYRYAFHLGSNFYDYPHLGVWPDGYYMAMNVFNSAGTAFLGPQAFVFDRSAMLLGTAGAAFIAAPLGASTDDAFLPSDLDGATLPPNGAPNSFVDFPSGGTYNIRHFHADFVTPANSTFTLFASPAAAAFTVLCPGTRSCVPQLGTGPALDGIGDRLMFRLAYRAFGDHESIVGNFTVDAGGVAGIRWFELRSVSAGTPVVFQESTYQPDTTWRWMGSIAQDSSGNIALGFSASDATIKPQIRYAGRLAADPLNQLAQGEAHLFDGTGVQNGGLQRWGDYSSLTLDPADDCTFWYTTEYIPADGSFNWATRIGSFRFNECGTPGFSLSAAPQNLQVCAGTPAMTSITVGSVSSFNSPVTLGTTNVPAPGTAFFTPAIVPALPGSSSLQINTGGVASGQYVIGVNGTAVGADPRSTNVNLRVFAAAPSAVTQSAPANGATNQPPRPTFSWSASNATDYTLQIATDAAFATIVYSATVTGTSAVPNVDLASSTPHFWRVIANNACGGSAPSATFVFTTAALPGDCPAGSTAQSAYSYGFETGLGGWTLGAGSTGNTWADNPTAHSGAHSWKANDTGAVSDQRLISPPIVLPSGQSPLTLSFWHKRDMEANGSAACYDGGILEASSDAGVTWTQVPTASLLADPYTGTVSSSFLNPLAGKSAWCGAKDWTRAVADLNAYAGSTVQFRYRLGSDSSVGHDGWYLDDVSVQGCTASVSTPPVAAITPSQFDLAATVGAGTSSTLHIGNTGGDPLIWSILEAPAAPEHDPQLLAQRSSRSGGEIAARPPQPNPPRPLAVVVDQGFDDITTLAGAGWLQLNHSTTVGTTNWFQGNPAIFTAFDGATNGYIGANYKNTTGTGTISNWLIAPPVNVTAAGGTLTFYTRTTTGQFPDRLQVRACTSGDCTDVGTTDTDVGNFTTLLLDINPTYTAAGYPTIWTQYSVNLPAGTLRAAFRYFVENGGPTGSNSDYIGIDRVVFDDGSAPPTGCAAPTDVPWLSVDTASGAVNGGLSQDVGVNVDASSLTAGSYSAHVCVSTNDSTHALVDVPVNLTVVAAPTLTKAFAPTGVAMGTPSTATLTLGNTQASAISLTAALVDALPTGLVVATTPNAATTCVGAAVTASAGASSFSLGSGAQIPAAGSCTVSVDVVSAAAGSYVNTIPIGALQTSGGSNVSNAVATLTVYHDPSDRIFCDGLDGIACGPFAPTSGK